jgi:hypothetical protein
MTALNDAITRIASTLGATTITSLMALTTFVCIARFF